MSSVSVDGADRLKGLEKSVWVEFTGLAKEHNAVNVGQVSCLFPPFMTAFLTSRVPTVVKALVDAATSSNILLNQYTRSYGHPRLVNVVGKLYSKLLEHELNPMTDILITVGAYGALFYAVFGLLNPGDEAIIVEPYYDCYEPMVRMAGGKPVFVPLRLCKPTENRLATSDDLKLDFDEFEAKFNEKTKLLFLNNPNNPAGKVFTKAELDKIASIVRKHPKLIVISDEVYEWLVYKPNKLYRFATLPNMFERTLTIGSAGKTFSVTGWKTGWVIGPEPIMRHLQAVHQNCVYTCPTTTQEAIAVSFEKEIERLDSPECFFNSLPELLRPKRDRMVSFFHDVGMSPIVPDGGYFLLADFSALHGPFEKDEGGEPKDYRFIKWLCREKKLAGIPTSAFYSREHKPMAENLARFCFIKQDSTIDAAEQIVRKWAAEQSGHCSA